MCRALEGKKGRTEAGERGRGRKEVKGRRVDLNRGE